MDRLQAKHILYTVVILSFTLYQCRHITLYQPAAPIVSPASSLSPVSHIPLSIPSDTLDSIYDGLTRKRAVASFYRSRHSQSAWYHDEQAAQRRDSLLSFIKETRLYGLSPSRYHLRELYKLTELNSEQSQQRYELLLTDAFIRMHQEFKTGTSTVHSWARDSVSILVLENILINGNVAGSLLSQQPDHLSYRALIHSLKYLLDSETADDQDSIKKTNTIQTIAVNLERWRHEGKLWESRYAIVNMPSFTIDVIDKTDTVLSSRVIVGKADHPTPELSSVIECFTLYPYWHVPRKISVEEYLPVMQKDTSFLSKNNFDVLDRKGNVIDPKQVPWMDYHKNNFPVVLRQREGTDNALGLIKFTFDNPYAVYLHDTNAKKLFKNDFRAFSHGCIRMEKAEALAHYLMTGGVMKQSQFVRKYLDTKTRIVINVPEPLPIYVRYLTAQVFDGVLKIYPDIYGSDRAWIAQWKKRQNENQIWLPIGEEE
jgi:murein L,D-transpeptidase YcbB/YkuD